jgi:hypothetical protein
MPAEELPRAIHDQQDTTEEHSFDELAKGLADSTVSRGRALKMFTGALLGASLLALIPRVAGASDGSQGGGGSIGGGGGGRRRHKRRRRRGGRLAGCPRERRCRASNTCCPRSKICARGGGVCCPPVRVCTVGGVANACCPGTCVGGVCFS